MPKTTIFTLDARDNIFLEVSRDHFEITSQRMYHEIQGIFCETLDILKEKRIDYGLLKSALVPNPTRREIALIFDSSRIEEGWYGLEVFDRVLPLLPKEGNQSVLSGDYIGENQNALFEAFEESVLPVQPINFRHSSQFFVVYLNNLTDSQFEKLARGLQSYEGYVGFSDMTFESRFKIFLSTMLPNTFLKHRNIVLMGHEDDRSNSENVNIKGYSFEENGLVIRSMTATHYDLFLSYKIERPVFRGFEVDMEFSLNAVHPNPKPLAAMNIRIDDNKHTYLRAEKGDSLKRIGLLNSHVDDLRAMIAERISSNYIYNMTYDDDHNVSKFDILVEVRPKDALQPLKVMVALEYQPAENALRVITLY